MEKILKVKDFGRTLNEDIYIDFKKKSTEFKLRQPALKSVWARLQTECGGKYDALLDYLSARLDRQAEIGDVIEHLRELIEQSGCFTDEIYVRPIHNIDEIIDFEQFVKMTDNLDFCMTVETLLQRLNGLKSNEAPNGQEPVYLGQIHKICALRKRAKK